MASATGQKKLPQKENAIFKKVVVSTDKAAKSRCYECKQYKNALKYCRQILSNPKFTEHGETLAMKGLVLNSIGRKEEANEFVKKGLKNDLQSHVCWHVYGLVHRSNKKYDEAVKCYRNALKWDKENVQIFRDLSIVQLQMREMEGFRDSRFNLLKLRPSQQSSWIGYALAYYFLKDFATCLKVISEYRKTMMREKVPYEYSEVVLFELMVMREAENYSQALEHMGMFKASITDDLYLNETKAAIYQDMGRFPEAEGIYRDLVHRNPENKGYLENLVQCLHLDSEETKLTLYQQLASNHPRSRMIQKMRLFIATGEVFRSMMDEFLQSALQKSVPSIYVSIRVHYDKPEKVKILEYLITGYVESLKTYHRLDRSESGLPEPPSTLLWATVLAAQHYDAVGDHVKALAYIDEALKHTPTDVQIYMVKAKIYKHAGNLLEAARWMEEARVLDTADRFVNCKCVKYFFRVNQVESAIEIASLFTREGLAPLETMDDMQCMWFQTELALAYYRLGKLGEALQKLHEVDKHFTDMVDDQFDFHSYCLRKTTLRSYIGVLMMEDRLRCHSFYVDAAKTAIEIYLFLHDHPEAKKGAMNGPLSDSKDLSAPELKKLQRKERKAQHKAAQAKALEEKKENKPPNKGEQEKPDERKVKFVAKDLLNADDPLEEAIKFLSPLQSLSGDQMLPHLLAYSVYSRKRKYLLMLQSIRRARAVDPENGELHANIVDFILAFESEKNMLEPVKKVIRSFHSAITEGKSLLALNADFLERHKNSLDRLIPACKVLYQLQPRSGDKAIACIINLSDTMSGCTLQNCLKVHSILQSGGLGPASPATVAAYEEACQKLFPLAMTFKSETRKTPSETSENPSSLPVAQVKDVAAKSISAAGTGVVILKETALSSAAMSDLSGDINDGATKTSGPDNKLLDIVNTTVEVGAN